MLGRVKSSVSLLQSLNRGGKFESKNTTQIKAAVVREKGGPFSIETLSLEGPRRDEVLVKVVATGLCHTDMVARDKGYPVRNWLLIRWSFRPSGSAKEKL